MSDADVQRGAASAGGKTMGRAAYSYRIPGNYPSPFYYDPGALAGREWTSWIVPMIVVANVAVFVGIMCVNDCSGHRNPYGSCVAGFLRRFSFQPLRENPLLGPSSSTLQKLGALEWDKVAHSHIWFNTQERWLTPACMRDTLSHVDTTLFIKHFENNFLIVQIYVDDIIFGSSDESLCESFAKCMSHEFEMSLMGELTFFLGLQIKQLKLITNWTIYTNKASSLFTLLVIIMFNLAVGILPHVDNYSHIGGFLTGFLLGSVLLIQPQFGWLEGHNLPPTDRVKSKHMAYQYILWVMSLILLGIGLVVGLVMLFRGVNGNGNDHCHWCHYLSCVPTSRWSCRN
ncbi:unnamed protein product, partial [Musa acuminata var. zebrina]